MPRYHSVLHCFFPLTVGDLGARLTLYLPTRYARQKKTLNFPGLSRYLIWWIHVLFIPLIFPSISPIKVQHKLIIVNLNEIVHCISKPFVLITILHFNFCVHVFMENNKLNWKKLTDDLDNMMNAFTWRKFRDATWPGHLNLKGNW